ncbi:deoxyuridine 5'-triphosphate nucleotidohydrolase-like isoform X1 [Homalodisca vitripennis]|uniref:deoxyuridine 5'-triphosphate nucleotidohydrolase-like isoform X1 n=1 Tax=Homalodisca vitripennis TaxID=197043 RepID=UPI001EEBCACF|nr:deoxyuridine 5'-triphosphate nucleotidohydrolase-like isoform X1 [Homalodisca vitripennis]
MDSETVVDLTQSEEHSSILRKLLSTPPPPPLKQQQQQQQKQQQKQQQQQQQQLTQQPSTSSSFASNTLKFIRLSENGFPPERCSPLAAGFDLRSGENVVIKKWDRKLVKTNIAIVLPDECYGRIAPRSGLSLKNGIHVGAGVIDPDYRGNVGIVLFNLSNDNFSVEIGDRIAQLICERIVWPDIEEVTKNSVLEKTSRDENGFGSTGLK